MMEDRQILFEKYLSGQLSASEVAQFEAQLSSDPSFAEDYKLYQSMHSFLDESLKHKESLAALREIGAQQRKAPSEGEGAKVTYLRNHRISMWAAASVAFLVAFGSYFWLNKMERNKTPSYAELVTEPLWDPHRGDDGDSTLIKMTSYALAGMEGKAIQLLHNSTLNQNLKHRWIAEMHARMSQPDSVLVYTSELASRSLRTKYLYIISLFETKQYNEVVRAIDQLTDAEKKAYQETYYKLYQLSQDQISQN